MKIIPILFLITLAGCAANCNNLRLSSSDVENGEYNLSLCNKIIGDNFYTYPEKNSPMYNYYEDNIDNYLKYSNELQSCTKQKGSLMFYESGRVISVDIKCNEPLNLKNLNWGTYVGNKKLHVFETDAKLTTSK